jgi:adenylate cyclase
MNRTGKVMIGVGIGVLAAIVAWAVERTGLLDVPELWTFDARMRWYARPADDAAARIRLILIDNDSLRWASRENDLPWPWPRDVYTYILDYCAQAGAKAFVFDALFVHHSPGGIVSHDEALGESIARQSLFVTAVLPSREAGHALQWPDDLPRPRYVVEPLFTWLEKWARGDALVFPTADLPIPEVVQPPSLLGHVQGSQDADGKFRRVSMLTVFDGQVIPALPLALFAADPVGPGMPPRLESIELSRQRLIVRGRAVPIDDAGRALLRFRRPGDDGQLYRSYSAKAVIQSALLAAEGREPIIPPADLKDAVVFFGASATALFDLKPHPMDARGSGVSLHATAYDNLVQGDFLRPVPPMAVVAVALLLAVVASVLATLGRTLPEVAAVAAVCLPLTVVLGYATFDWNWWWPVAGPVLAVGLAWVGGLAFNYATEGRQRRYLRRAFAQYVSPVVVDRIVREPGQLQLGGELRTLTIFFSDVENFSALAHDLGPTQVTTLLNTYLSDMAAILFEEQGTLDKYEGDAIIAFWNAPLDQPDHALRACRAAMRCQRRLVERDAFYRSLAGGRPLRMRIGIHTGEVIVGNIGSAERFDYSMLGEAANLASRLEGANKHMGTRLLVSEHTWRLLEDRMPGRDLGRIVVMGGAEPLRVYELLIDGDAASPRCVEFALALKQAGDGDSGAALERLKRFADDSAAAALAAYLRSLPGPWDGVRRMDSK